MDQTMETWLIILASAAAVSVLIQLGVLVALLVSVRRLRATIHEIRSSPDWIALRNIIREKSGTVRETLDSIDRITANLAEVTERIKTVTTEASEITRRQLSRTDRLATSLLSRLEQIGALVETGIALPFRKVKAVSSGVRFAVALLLKKNPESEGRNIP